MDAFLHFLLQTNKWGNRLFVSEAPGPVFLIWAAFENERKIAGITLVKRENRTTEGGVDYRTVLSIIRKALQGRLPVLEIIYNDDVTSFEVDGEQYDNEQAARLIAGKLGIRLGSKGAKRPNDPGAIRDPFHVWSREVFDGIMVRKADIDALLLTETGDAISAIIEIKRSAKNPIGQWTPYMEPKGNTDYWNYMIGISFSKMVAAHFLTFHHELMMADNAFTEETKVELFTFKAPAIVCKESLEAFAATANRKILTGKDFLT